jgi:hypothetical protein
VHVALVKYSVMRLAIFVASLIVLWAVGVRQSILMLVLAALVSLALSYVLLRKPREQLALALENRTRDRLDRHVAVGQSDADEEDAIIDAAAAQSAQVVEAPPELDLDESADRPSESKAPAGKASDSKANG